MRSVRIRSISNVDSLCYLIVIILKVHLIPKGGDTFESLRFGGLLLEGQFRYRLGVGLNVELLDTP
jgi:hypothetical protein